MNFKLYDVLDIIIEYIHRNKKKNELVNVFFNPVISFINITRKYYKYCFCKKYINIKYDSNIFYISNNLISIIYEYIEEINVKVEFDIDIFFKILSIFLCMCNNIIKNIENEINIDNIENEINIDNIEKIKYYNEMKIWIKNDCFQNI